jgi:hypothetical protein
MIEVYRELRRGSEYLKDKGLVITKGIKKHQMLHMKIKGLFQCLPKESMTLERICSLTNSSKEEVQPILLKLVKEGVIVGKKKFRLKKVPKHVRDIPVKKC